MSSFYITSIDCFRCEVDERDNVFYCNCKDAGKISNDLCAHSFRAPERGMLACVHRLLGSNDHRRRDAEKSGVSGL